MFGNSKKVRRFTEQLYELVVKHKFNLISALEIMKNSKFLKLNQKNRSITSIAEAVSELLKKGNKFSYSLRITPGVRFDRTYCAFIGFAEKSGNLEETLSFLRNRCKRQEETKSKILEAAIYPLFVIFLAVLVIIVLCIYGEKMFYELDLGIDAEECVKNSFLFSFLFLAVFSSLFFSIIKRKLGSNRLYEAFLAVSFLVNSGISLENAVSSAINILGEDTVEGKLFARAEERLSIGFDMKSAFQLEIAYGEGRYLNNEIQEAIYYLEAAGASEDIFSKIAEFINERNKKQRIICFKLVEPLFITATGIFLLIFLGNIAMPVLSNMANYI